MGEPRERREDLGEEDEEKVRFGENKGSKACRWGIVVELSSLSRTIDDQDLENEGFERECKLTERESTQVCRNCLP